MSRNYNLDTTAAKAADQMNSRIDASGKYIGIIQLAHAVTSKKGTDGVEISFKSDDGQSADFLQLWTHNASGESLPSFKTLNAVMTCAQARTLTPTKTTAEKWMDGQKAPVQVDAFPELTGKRMGFLLQREEYLNGNGEPRSRMQIVAPFCPETSRTASEILAKAQKAETLEKMLATLKDKPLPTSQARAPSAASSAPQSAGFEDDIPW